LPPDVLRQIDMVNGPRLIRSDGVALAYGKFPDSKARCVDDRIVRRNDDSAPSGIRADRARLQSRVGDNWQIGFRGNLHRVKIRPQDNFGTAVAASSAAAIEIRSSPTDSYRLTPPLVVALP